MQDLLYHACGGSATDLKTIERGSYMDLLLIVDNYMDKINRTNEEIEKINRKTKTTSSK